MPKGKKFDAAEKHFMEQKEKLDKNIKMLQAANKEKSERIDALEEELRAEQSKSAKLQGMIDEMIQHSNMSISELEAHIEKTKNASDGFSMLKTISNFRYGIIK